MLRQRVLREENIWGSQWRKAAHQTRMLPEPSRNLTRGHIQAVSSLNRCQAVCLRSPACITGPETSMDFHWIELALTKCNLILIKDQYLAMVHFQTGYDFVQSPTLLRHLHK